jgi:hypothetical protein
VAAVLHQLPCLNVLCAELETQLEHAGEHVPGCADALVHHWMRDVRQTSMCRGTLLENVKWVFPNTGTTTSDITHVFKDWPTVFPAA